VELDAETRTVTRPEALQIDLGGLVKGRTVDQAAACLPAIGAIDAGGDAVMRGADWPVHVEDPRDSSHTIASLTVRDRAVATSAPNRRHWKVGGEARHHIVDPRTQRSAKTDLLQATVIAQTAELADVCAKTIFVLGADAGREFAARMNVTCVLVTVQGKVLS
jgi:thiamine biosynthesis lipoprotein